VTAPRLLGVGGYLPSRTLTNAQLETMVETTDQWILERTGIATRHIAADDESVATMAVEAGAKAIAASGIDATDIDLVLSATCSMPYAVPGAAATIAHSLGIPAPGACDVNAGCASFTYAMAWAADAIKAGSARRVLVTGSEKISPYIDYTDRGVCIIFGDGAGAAVVAADDRGGIGPVIWGSDGAQAAAIQVPAGEQYLRMDGASVFRWATSQMVDVARRACAAGGVKVEDLAAFVPHQANLRIVDSLARSLKIPDELVARNVVHTGNTSAASVPLALDRLAQEGRLPSGEPMLLMAFGAGLTYAAQVVNCP